MATIYTTDDGAKVRIGEYGIATTTRGVEVPEAVADELVRTYKHPWLLRIVSSAPVDLPALPPAASEPEPAAPKKRGRQE